MAIEDRIPSFQESMRKHGYPRLVPRTIETIVRGPDSQTIHKESKKQWEFIDKDKRASVLVDAESISYQVTRYDVFEAFMEAMSTILGIFEGQVEPTLTQRIGLRYVDLVVPEAGKEIQAYFNDSLRGFTIDHDISRQAFFAESVLKTGSNSTFVHRYVEASSGFGFPPDLLPSNLQFRRDPKVNGPFGLLDLDHFLVADEDFSMERIQSVFSDLHEYQTLAFKRSVTEEALNEWGQQ